MVKNPPANARELRDLGSIPGWEDPLEEGIATHSSILAWRIPWTEEPGGLQSMGLQRVGYGFSFSICVSSHPELTSNLLKPIGFISIVSLLFFLSKSHDT